MTLEILYQDEHLVAINKPTLRVRYEYRDHAKPTLREVLLRRFAAIEETKAGRL